MHPISLDPIDFGWREVPIKHIASCNDDLISEDQDASSLIRYVDISSVDYGAGIVACEELAFGAAPSRARRLAQVGDVLVSTVRTYLKAIAPVTEEHADCVFSTGFAILRAKAQHVCPAYLRWLLLDENFIQRVQAHSEGLSYPAINASSLIDLKVRIPDRQAQIAIAAFLDVETRQIDALVARKKHFIALLSEKEKVEISNLVRLGINPEADYVESGCDWRGRVPRHWTRSRLSANFRVTKRQGLNDLTVLSVYRDYGVIPKLSRDDNANKTPEDLSSYQLVEVGDLVVNKMKAWQGSMGISEHHGFTSPDYVVLKPLGENSSRYMHHYLRAQPMPWMYRCISNGIRENQWRMEPDKFLALPVYLPPLPEQEAIANEADRRVARIRALVAATDHSIELLLERRSALIAAAGTGKIDVRGRTNQNMKAAA